MKQKDILLLAISVFFVIIVWIGFSIYFSFFQSTIPAPTQEKIQPIQPDFNNALIDKIKGRENVEPLYQISSESAQTSLPETAQKDLNPPQEITPPEEPGTENPEGITEEPLVTVSPETNS